MQLDEEGTHARVKRIQRDLIEPSIAEHHGRLVKTTGDGFPTHGFRVALSA